MSGLPQVFKSLIIHIQSFETKIDIGLGNRGAVKILRQWHIWIKLLYSPEHNRYNDKSVVIVIAGLFQEKRDHVKGLLPLSFNLFTPLVKFLRDNKNIFEELKNTASSLDAWQLENCLKY